jgi:hypothetical protein
MDPGTLAPSAGAFAPALARICREFPEIEIAAAARSRGAVAAAWISEREWGAPTFDLAAFDAQTSALAARGPFSLGVSGDANRLERAALEILTRCQRLSPRRNQASRGALFDRMLERHRALHNLDKPLVRADYDHALDTWQWTLRISPGAGLGLQAAALFHDVERLASEADVRIEHRAADYQAFKDAHAARGARMAKRALAEAGLPPVELERAIRLIACHEQPRGDPDLDLLNDADGLSFFSLNSGGFMDYYGFEHTCRKVAYTLARLRPEARFRLAGMRLRGDIARLVEAALRNGRGGDQ